MLAGRRRARACWAFCCGGLGCDVWITKGSEGIRARCLGGVDFIIDRSGESAVVPGEGVAMSGVEVREPLRATGLPPT